MSNLLVEIKGHMKDAMRNKEKVRLNAIRMLLAAIKQIEVDQRIEVQDTDILAVLDKMIKQRRDSISQFEINFSVSSQLFNFKSVFLFQFNLSV